MNKDTGKRYATPAKNRETSKNRPVKGKKGRKRHPVIRFLTSLCICVIVVVVGFFCVFSYYYGMLIYNDGNWLNPSAAENVPDLIKDGANVSGELGELIDKMGADLAKYDILSSSDVTNILLIGVDDRSDEMTQRSDSMILVSINNKTQKIYMTSFMRDTWVYIPGYGYQRLNVANLYGGPQLLMETLEYNFKIHVEKYAMVNFMSFIDIVNEVGGVEIEVTDEEIQYINEYIYTYSNEVDDTFVSVPGGVDEITEAGTYNLNGMQALAYCRIRYVGDDFERTNRQRKVMTAVFEKAKGNPASIPGLVEVIFPMVTTNISSMEMLGMCANAPSYLSYELISQRVPADGTWYNYTTDGGADVLGVDLDANITLLRDTIYAEY